MPPAEPDLVLSLRFLPGGNEDQRLKKALKALKRYWGLVCVEIDNRREAPAPESPSNKEVRP